MKLIWYLIGNILVLHL